MRASGVAYADFTAIPSYRDGHAFTAPAGSYSSDAPGLQAMDQVHKNVRDDGADNNTADEFIAKHAAECAAHFIKLSVAPDAKTYTVSIPATGHTRTFPTREK